MKSETGLMLEKLLYSQNFACREIAYKILNGLTTIEKEQKYSGGFMTSVLRGDTKLALSLADGKNSAVLRQTLRNLWMKRDRRERAYQESEESRNIQHAENIREFNRRNSKFPQFDRDGLD